MMANFKLLYEQMKKLVGTYQNVELTGSNTWSFFGKLN